MASAGPSLFLPGAGASLAHRPKITFPLAVFNEQRHWVAPEFGALDGPREGARLLTFRESLLMDCMDGITEKPQWVRKVYDEAIVEKWRAETVDSFQNEHDVYRAISRAGSHATSHSTDNEQDTDVESSEDGAPENASVTTDQTWSWGFSPRMFDWAIAELRYKARILPKIHCIEALDGVWKSDTIVPTSLQESLRSGIAKLENLPAKDLDWHPGSDGQVLDIVHPSIYPLVYGVSRVLMDTSRKCGVNDCLSWVGQGSTSSWQQYTQSHPGREYSKNYQWLPSEVQCSPKTDAVEIHSYINNLHPLQEDTAALYPLLEKLIESAIPLWNRTLSPFKTNKILPPRISDWSNSRNGLGYSLDSGETPEQGSDEDDDEFEDRYQQWDICRTVVHPEPGPEGFREPSLRIREAYAKASRETDRIEKYWDVEPLVDLRRDDFGDGQRGRLQIIVKVAHIHLTPEKPRYEGGNWHVEGMANESICATALYYHTTNNVTSSRLSLRQQTEDSQNVPYEQGDWKAMEEIYGFTNREAAIQELGSVLTCEGRLLTFPNVMQQRVESFRLEDETQPGYRKLIALFLVDPHVRIISTAEVPPQQKIWWKDAVRTIANGNERREGLGILPVELQEQVLDATDGFPITLEETKHQRTELMRERTDFVEWQDEVFKHKDYFNVSLSNVFPLYE